MMAFACSRWLECTDCAFKDLDVSEISLGLRTDSRGGSITRGKVASSESELLISPLTHRRCVAYCVREGYWLGGGLVLLNERIPVGKAVPFAFEDGTRVTISGWFYFVPGLDTLRAVIRPCDLPPEKNSEFENFGGWELSENKRARYVEWILPVGAGCAISGGGSPSSEYRGVREAHINDAQILLLPSENHELGQKLSKDRAALEALSRSVARRRRISLVAAFLLSFGGIGLFALDISRRMPDSVEVRQSR